MVEYKNGVINNILGNIKKGVIYEASSRNRSNVVGYVEGCVIYSGPAPGRGKAILNVADGKVMKISSSGKSVPAGRVRDFEIEGMQRESEAEMVAAYHFLVEKIV